MKMIFAIVRPEKLKDVTTVLDSKGFSSLTEMSVRGRGKQRGIHIGNMIYDKLPKEMVIIVCQNKDYEEIIKIVIETAQTGNIGDGKIFVVDVGEEYTIRTGEKSKEDV
ncbi:MAG: P-II family nitrogen regulator [Spirochaetales bacterium]|nr:P-II family nitrogen regulator [Spirochaetales bacterium]